MALQALTRPILSGFRSPRWKQLITAVSTVFLISCGNIGFYSQSIAGQWEIISKRRPITEIIADPETDSRLEAKFRQVLAMREFASQSLGLPDNAAYRSYTHLDRRFVIWNVIAAPEFSLEPVEWCFIVVGCLPYRGYFDQQDAINFAARLKDRGYDVHVGGVVAYSTLGWFDDPVLSTMINGEITTTARIIFHELAHQHTFIKNDADFNEAFADTVAQIGIRQWLTVQGSNGDLASFNQKQKREQDFFNLVSIYKNKLNDLYQADIPIAEKQAHKSAIFRKMTAEYQTIRSGWGNEGREYDDWFIEGLNNAKMATVLTYRNLVPALLSMYEKQGRDLSRFYDQVDALGRCSETQRRRYLEQGMSTLECMN